MITCRSKMSSAPGGGFGRFSLEGRYAVDDASDQRIINEGIPIVDLRHHKRKPPRRGLSPDTHYLLMINLFAGSGCFLPGMKLFHKAALAAGGIVFMNDTLNRGEVEFADGLANFGFPLAALNGLAGAYDR